MDTPFNHIVTLLEPPKQDIPLQIKTEQRNYYLHQTTTTVFVEKKSSGTEGVTPIFFPKMFVFTKYLVYKCGILLDIQVIVIGGRDFNVSLLRTFPLKLFRYYRKKYKTKT